MRALFLTVVLSISWCDSLDGCTPKFPHALDGSDESDEVASSAPTGPDIHDTAATSTEGTFSATGPDATSPAAPTLPGESSNSTAPDATGSDTDTPTATGPAETTTDDTDGGPTLDDPTTCGDTDIDPDEECEDGITGAPDQHPEGVARCVDCAAVRAVDLAAGDAHACVLLDDGHVRCWDTTAGPDAFAVEITRDSAPIDGTGGDIDFATAVHDPGNTNGRLFAGGAITCLRIDDPVPDADAVLCWGGPFGPEPVALAHGYSALAISDDDDDDNNKTYLMCGLDESEGDYDLRCWGELAAGFAMFDDGDMCKIMVDEASAQPRKDIPASDPPVIEAGLTHACTPTADGLRCFGYGKNGNACGPTKCASSHNNMHECPSSCDASACGAVAQHVSVRAEQTWMLAPAGTAVELLGSATELDLATLCSPADVTAFEASALTATDTFVCVLDAHVDPTLACCGAVDGGPAGALPMGEKTIVKMASHAGGVLMLTDHGEVLRIEVDDQQPTTWSVSHAYP